MSDKEKKMPVHVAMIMDGNGRWAKERGMARGQGHAAGMEALRTIVSHSATLGIKYLTVYAFSTENWKRPPEEVFGIFRLLVRYFASEIDELNRNNVKINILGDWSALPEDARDSVAMGLKKTENNTGLVFNICLNYGGRAEIADALKKLAMQIRQGTLDPDDITEDMISANLYLPEIPDPDLIIRTAGEYRLSNFLTWESAYSELVITPVYWPDFDADEYDRCIDQYMHRERRFGGLK